MLFKTFEAISNNIQLEAIDMHKILTELLALVWGGGGAVGSG